MISRVSSVLSCSLLLVIIVMVDTHAYGQKIVNSDLQCPVRSGILCVKDELEIIAIMMKSISRLINKLESSIKQTEISSTLDHYVEREMNLTRSNLPTLAFHVEFLGRSNIDKKFLIQLIREAYLTISFFYISVEDLTNNSNVLTQRVNSLLKEIEKDLRDEVLCRYRHILYLFAEDWPSISHIKPMEYTKKHFSPSLVHDIHSVVLLRYLYQSMEDIHGGIKQIGAKYF